MLISKLYAEKQHSLQCVLEKKGHKGHFEDAISRVRPTVTPEMLEYYSKMEERLTSGLSNIKRTRDTGYGMESM